MNTHLHITAWALAIILLLIVIVLQKTGKAKGAKITHMILRLDYLLILYSGGSLLTNYLNGGGPMMTEAIIKSIAGLWVIVAMEIIAVRTGKRKAIKGAWIQLIIALIITIALGFGRLEGGLLP